MAERGRPKRETCKNCDRHISECGTLSSRALCADCGVTRMAQNAIELNAMQGESLKRWRARSILAAGGILPEDLKPYA